ncbi:hypothetical protein SAMN05216480_101843 [Pustulibacterium marinum]|uniref:Serine aminopeptidase S33 domain-containing protein n=1 Tax=Pustulibacterium marinum TaxID=1224947 RepID=A0A1I7FCD2_9FLAO|nr:alpha/beta fold hydrolase [Pustulibacterium marinum]SFU33771.1 hypothetical protein SAMN05216480_101843 [Pustulibacterium marinum]
MYKIAFILITFLVSQISQAQEVGTEEIQLFNDHIELPGTLSYPKTSEKIPLVIFIHGSGNVDRNGNQAGVNINAAYIQQLADSLNTENIAFYRYDKRTATVSNLEKSTNVTLDDFVEDAEVAIDHFKGDKRFSEIVLIGHSQGSLIAMLVAQKGTVSKYISLNGPGNKISETIIEQIGDYPELVTKAREHFDELEKTDTIVQVHPFLMNIFVPQNQKFLKNWNSYSPTLEIAKLKIPVLIIQGEADLQVGLEDAKMLQAAQPKAQLVLVTKMNHVLKTVENPNENQQSYYNSEFPLSSQLVDTISEFIKQ